MAAVGNFGCPKFTLDHISGYFVILDQYRFFIFFKNLFTKWLLLAIFLYLISGHFRSIHNFCFEIFDKMAAVSHFGCQKFTLDHISVYFISIQIFEFFFTKWLSVAILDVRKSLSISFLSISDRYAMLIFFEIFCKMADDGHFGCQKFTFDRISGHFRLICNFNFFWKFLTKWLPVAIMDVQNSLLITISVYFISIQIFEFFLQNGCRWPFWMSENHFRSHFYPFQIDMQC